MEVLALLLAAFVIALAIAALRARRNLRNCCSVNPEHDLRMRDPALDRGDTNGVH